MVDYSDKGSGAVDPRLWLVASISCGLARTVGRDHMIAVGPLAWLCFLGRDSLSKGATTSHTLLVMVCGVAHVRWTVWFR